MVASALLIGCTFSMSAAQTNSQDSVPKKFEIIDDPAKPKMGYQGFYNYKSKKLKSPKRTDRKSVVIRKS